MPLGILIPVDMDKPLELKQLDGLRPLQEAVGGLIEPMTIERPEATIFVNEEGVLMDVPVNRRASLILWVGLTRYRSAAPILGDAVLIGVPNDDGVTQDVPYFYRHLLLEAKHFRVQMQPIDDMMWRQHDKVFTDWITAYNTVLRYAEKNALVNHVRVVAG
ncbi:DUF3846 domain-containing protein [Arthrobacter sp. EpRS71]|uniref:DUF3846 domain-containing protein n=1 Tax=Arthrobacter sp. EpRS71 TaxID=1743141 RepID=UPI0007494D27|nr:DUF3846 domain-containing protein [Arthrobacter sp. EpRS71]KUM38978.1 hypothetical protein AR689_07440 [Arthrobacter sp. EpRS71]